MMVIDDAVKATNRVAERVPKAIRERQSGLQRGYLIRVSRLSGDKVFPSTPLKSVLIAPLRGAIEDCQHAESSH